MHITITNADSSDKIMVSINRPIGVRLALNFESAELIKFKYKGQRAPMVKIKVFICCTLAKNPH